MTKPQIYQQGFILSNFTIPMISNYVLYIHGSYGYLSIVWSQNLMDLNFDTLKPFYF